MARHTIEVHFTSGHARIFEGVDTYVQEDGKAEARRLSAPGCAIKSDYIAIRNADEYIRVYGWESVIIRTERSQDD